MRKGKTGNRLQTISAGGSNQCFTENYKHEKKHSIQKAQIIKRSPRKQFGDLLEKRCPASDWLSTPAGSPFQFTVGPITEGGAHKVHAAGPGLEQGFVGLPNEFTIYTREAGAGGLSIAIEGPSKAEIDFEDRKDGSCGVNYHVQEPGEYLCTIKFNDEHIPDSPFRIPVLPEEGAIKQTALAALQQAPAGPQVSARGACRPRMSFTAGSLPEAPS